MLRILKFILLLIAVIAAAVGGTMWFMSRDAGTPSSPVAVAAEAPPAPIVPTPIFEALEPFTVTLYGEMRNRILYTGITLRLGDEASRKQIQDYMPEVRDRILRILSAQELTRIQTPEGRQALTQTLKTALSKPFSTQLPGPQVTDVLFTAFVVQ